MNVPSAPAPPAPGPTEPRIVPASLGRYFAGVAITVFVILSQYFVPQTVPATRILYDNLPGDLFIVYGIPVIAFAILVGRAPLRHWRDRMGLAGWEGLRWFGLLSALALITVIALAVVYEALDPSALGLLNKPNPALTQAEGNPWFFVGFSFVIGAFEETIFRGWFFGYWRDRPGSWLAPATWTSAVFAGVHLYYGTTYGAAYPLIFPTLFLTGFAFAAAYRFSGGNLVVPALLHGASDASAFLTLVSLGAGLALHYGIIFVGLVIALVDYLRNSGGPVPVTPVPPWPAASTCGGVPAGTS
jgi:membrane protease YdiL (CAAX protease family)